MHAATFAAASAAFTKSPKCSPTKTSMGWLGTLATFSPLDAVLARAPSEFQAFGSTSFATLAGGLACFWAVLAMAPCVSYSAWAQAWRLSEPGGESNASTIALFELEVDESGALAGWSSAYESLLL